MSVDPLRIIGTTPLPPAPDSWPSARRRRFFIVAFYMGFLVALAVINLLDAVALAFDRPPQTVFSRLILGVLAVWLSLPLMFPKRDQDK